MVSPHSAATVLLVNHSADAQAIAREVAARAGFMPHTASNAFEALFQLGASRMDAVVCEKELPGRDSQWLSERVNHLYPGTPFIVSPSGTGLEWERALAQLWALRQTGDAAVASNAMQVAAGDAAAASQPGSAAPALHAIQTIEELVNQPLPEVELVPVDDIEEAEAVTPDFNAPVAGENGDERRRAPRFKPDRKVPVVLRGGREGILYDVSAYSALVETDAHVGPDRVVELRIGTGPDTLRRMVQVMKCDVVAVSETGILYRIELMFKSRLSDGDLRTLVGR